ncbi:uncharacterized protein (DUF952 family) [Catalinimonas alkaloidigena]|uniref:DUF952 domain-containing protein n=1 Tax=Catalinimonas alkaloidigena TaxID=1075417 RepID=UPI0024049BC6|nr:DUF952 domain-containing protein [Catalinimonas alkaloidigena]MDF9800735.1 uncharacterized protein (DUF952 family) [Catalinimonas alkaloidigena]
MSDVEENIAIAYLQQDEDKENKCILTSQRLIVIHRGRVNSFERHHIKDLGFSKRRIMLPLVSGGIMAPLSLLAIFLNLYNPWPLMFIFFLGLALFYLGWQQHPVLTVRDGVKEHDFFLKEATPNLRAFTSFARQVIFQGSSWLFYPILLEEWVMIKEEEVFEPKALKRKNFLRLMNNKQLVRWRQQKRNKVAAYAILHIDPLKVKANIRYETTERGSPELYAHVYGAIEREAIVKTEYS